MSKLYKKIFKQLSKSEFLVVFNEGLIIDLTSFLLRGIQNIKRINLCKRKDFSRFCLQKKLEIVEKKSLRIQILGVFLVGLTIYYSF